MHFRNLRMREIVQLINIGISKYGERISNEKEKIVKFCKINDMRVGDTVSKQPIVERFICVQKDELFFAEMHL